VEYYFETEQGGKIYSDSIKFNFADTKTVETSFTPPVGKGSFWVRLFVSYPNEKKDETKYEITCK
jgi:hypothetical protein